MLFTNFNQDKAPNYGICSPLIIPPSPVKSEIGGKFKGAKRLFETQEEEETREIDEGDTEWIVDVICDEKGSPEKPIEVKKSITNSKSDLRNPFSKSNFFKSSTGMGTKQVTVATARKLNFDSVATPVPRSRIAEKENTKQESRRGELKENQNARDFMNYISTAFPTPIESKESIQMVSRRLKEDLIEDKNSPSMIQYKNFSQKSKEWEKEGITAMITKVFEKISEVPKKIHWKIIIDLADFAKRENEFSKANTLFKMVTHLQPFAHQGWLDHAKMEEELGNIEKCRTLLKRGLKFDPLNEKLFLKTLKIEEKEGNYAEARRLIGSLKNNKIDETYKLLLEGILFEGRLGNIKTAQKAMKFLCKKFYKNGKVFQKAAEFEERIGNIEEAIKICEEGLDCNCSFGPLWFLLIKLASKVHKGYKFRYGNNLQELIDEAVNYIYSKSSDLISKLYLEAAQYQDKSENINLARKYLKEATEACNHAHMWKVWIIGARIEARIGCQKSSKFLIERALMEIPQKKESIGFLEYAKYFELIGRVDVTQKILAKARKNLAGDWKVFFESVLTLLRNGFFEKAEVLVKESLKNHSINGRLWATLIQLKHAKVRTIEDSRRAYSVFLKANKKIPKSGEVWCEGGRLLMSPVSHKFDLDKAERYLKSAIQFTPQYGDSFLELYRLYTLRGEIKKIDELKNT